MSDVLSPEKVGRGWIMDSPPEMAEAPGAGEGSAIVLYLNARDSPSERFHKTV